MNVRSCDVARRLSLISGSPFPGIPHRLAKSQTKPLLRQRENFLRSTEVQGSILAQLLGYVKEIRYQEPIFLYGEAIIEPKVLCAIGRQQWANRIPTFRITYRLHPDGSLGL